jgi:dTDP-4-amino-4,6-dideoxygalactose transaminase
VLGPRQKALEASVAAYCGCRCAVACSSGTDALLGIVMALGIGPGDEVICPAFTFFATAGVVARVGARPVFVDIDPATFNMDPKAFEAAITPATKAVIPVHLFGQMAEMETIRDIAGRHGIAIIEDAAQAIGATRHEKPAGAWGKACALSFYPTKNLNAMGDAGMIVTSDEDLAGVIRSLTVHGDTGGYNHVRVGGNFRMDELQAATLNVKFPHLASWHEARRSHAAMYNRLLAGLAAVKTPVIAPGNQSIYNQYVIRAERRDELMAHLRGRGIGCAVYYPRGLHAQECFAHLGYSAAQFPHTELACREVLALPVCPEISIQQVEEVAAAIRSFYQA